MTAKKKNEADELTFEKALGDLEAVVAEMESGKLSLDDTMKCYEKGMALAKLCTSKLGETERQIEILTKSANGDAKWTDFPDDPPGAVEPDAATDGRLL